MQVESGHFPASPIALRMAVAVGVGMLVGMEREWSNKDVGVRSFAIVALLGMLASVISSNLVIASLIGVLLLNHDIVVESLERLETKGRVRNAGGTLDDPASYWHVLRR